VTSPTKPADQIISDRAARRFPPDVNACNRRAIRTPIRPSGDTFLIVDPAGREPKEFINRRGDFTVNIALVEGGVTRPRVSSMRRPGRRNVLYGLPDGSSVEETRSISQGQ